MRKICFLLDPEKKEVSHVFKACCMLKNRYDREFIEKNLEFWVGCTNASGLEIRKWLIELKNENLGPRVIFPGKVSQAIYGYPHANYLMAPHLLNWSRKTTFLRLIFGLFLTSTFKKRIDFGYLVTSSNSTVGKRIGAKDLTNSQILVLAKKYVTEHPINPHLYIEAGSGAKDPVSLSVIKEIHEIMEQYFPSCLIVGGGIKSREIAEKFFLAGADKVVIGTALEQNDAKKSLRVMLEFLKLVE